MKTGRIIDSKESGTNSILIIQEESGECHEVILSKYEVGALLIVARPPSLSKEAVEYMSKLGYDKRLSAKG